MQLGSVLKKWRRMEDITVRAASKLMGVSAATLCRIENGETMDGVTLARILTWLTSEVR